MLLRKGSFAMFTGIRQAGKLMVHETERQFSNLVIIQVGYTLLQSIFLVIWIGRDAGSCF